MGGRGSGQYMRIPDAVKVPVRRTDAFLAAISDTPIGAMLDDLARFALDPLGFVKWAFPWGEKGTALETETGPEPWQSEQLDRIGARLREGVDLATGIFEGLPIEEDISSGHGVGKLLDINTVVPTPNGNRRHGDLQPGDLVFGADGAPTRVTQTHRFENVPMYRVTFDDGAFCDVSSGHLWNVRGRHERRNDLETWRTLETIELLRLGVLRANGVAQAKQWEIPIQGAVQHLRASLPIDPYLLGLWLGNGNQGTITQPQCADLRQFADGAKIAWRPYTDRNADLWSIGADNCAALRVLEVAQCRSWEKFIPPVCMLGSIEQRSTLLAGLMDSDGTIDSRGISTYDSVSKQLAEDVITLVRSLGGKAQMQATVKKPFYRDEEGEPVYCRDCYRVTVRMPFNPFRRGKKSARWKPCEHRYMARWIESIEPLPNAPWGQCISVEAPDGLYQANDFIVTHNSAIVSWLILWAISTHEDTRGIVTANTDTQLRTKTWAELSKWYSLAIFKQLFTFTATSIYIANDPVREKAWRIDATPWSENNTEAFAGMHNKNKRILVVFDEASTIADPVWDVTRGALTDEQTQIIWCRYGNPTRTSGEFHKQCTQPKRNHYARVDARNVRLSNKAQLAAWVDDYGEDSDFCRVRIKGMFPRAGYANFISPGLVTDARRRRIPLQAYQAYGKILACDPARFGDDFTVITLRQGLKVHWQVKMSGYDGHQVAGRLFEMITGDVAKPRHERKDALGSVCIVYDANGNGADLDTALRNMATSGKLKTPLIPVMWGVPAKDETHYFNQRSEAWGKMRDFMEHGEVPDDDELADQLTSLDYGYDGRFRIQLQSKKDLKKNGGKSPDCADSLALSFIPDLIDKKIVSAKAKPVQKRTVVWSR